MANVECYLCLAGASSGASLNTFQSLAGDPIGSCFRCGVFACGHHGLRNTSPVGWECVVCVPSNIAPPPGRGGGGPTRPQGPGGGPAPAASSSLQPYTEEEFVNAYPTSNTLLRVKVREAIEDPVPVMQEYFGEDYRQRVADAFAIAGEPTRAQLTRIAAAIAVILYAELPDHVLSPHLQRYPERAQFLELS